MAIVSKRAKRTIYKTTTLVIERHPFYLRLDLTMFLMVTAVVPTEDFPKDSRSGLKT